MSLWKNYQSDLRFRKLNENIEVDTLIIGGGIAGLTTMYFLRDECVCLVDASRIGEGVTQNTTGKLTYLQETIYTDLKKNVSEESAVLYLKSQKEAIFLAKEIIRKEKILCDLERVSSYIFTWKEDEIVKIEQEKNFLEQQKVKVFEQNLSLNIPCKYNIGVDDTYVFNPIKFINGLKEVLKERQIYENTKIVKIKYQDEKYYCFTSENVIIAQNVIVACHYPFFTIPFFLPLKSYIEKSYLIACKVSKNEKYSAITISNPGVSVRFYEDGDSIYKIGLASSHYTGIKQNDKENFLNTKRIFGMQDKDIVAYWSNVDVITDDHLPYIGKIKNNLYMATGFNTWGMTNGILAGKILSDSILGRQNIYEDLFSLKRHNFYKCKNFFINLARSIYSFIGSRFKYKKWYSSSIEIKNISGKSVGIYTDKNNKKHMVYTNCPHFGCGLIFNEKEKTWDCPCHSSRFSVDGKCIKGPSLYDISYKD